MVPIEWSPSSDRDSNFVIPAPQRAALVNALKARLNVRPGGFLHIIDGQTVAVTEACGAEPCCDSRSPHDHGADPTGDVQPIAPHTYWYLLEAAGICNPTLGCGGTNFAPYSWGAPPITPNPNRPPVSPGGGFAAPPHENVTRYWVGGATTFVVVAPPSASGQPDTLLDIFGGLYTTPTGGPASYTYGHFAWDVCLTFAKLSQQTLTPSLPGYFSNPVILTDPNPPEAPGPNPWIPPGFMGLPWSNVRAVFGGVVLPPAGNLPYYNPPPVPLANLVWSAPAGPTGNGLNEFIFLNATSAPLQNLIPGTPVGLTSMLVDPVTGAIVECDVVLNRNDAGVPGAGAPWPPFDSTVAATSGGPGWSTAIEHEVGHFLGLDHTNLHPGPFLVTAGVGRLVPVAPVPGSGIPPSQMITFPGQGTSFQQLPGMTGLVVLGTNSIGLGGIPFNGVGYYRAASSSSLPHTDDVAGVCGLYPVDIPVGGLGGVKVAPSINDFAEIRGRVFYDEDGAAPAFGRNVFINWDGSAAGTPPPPQPLLSFPPVGTVSGTARLDPMMSIVGVMDTGMAIATTGEFRIIHVPPTTGNTNVVIYCEPWEASASASLPGGPFNGVAEWWVHGLTIPLGIPETNLIPPLVVGPSTYNYVMGARPYPASVGSLACAAGTIIDVGISESATPGPGRENVSRPLVEIFPRTGIPTGGFFQATVRHDYQLDRRTLVWIDNNGTRIPVTGAVTTPPTSSGGGPYVTTFQISEAAVLPASSGARLVRLEAGERADPLSIDPVPPGVAGVIGVNELIVK